MRFKIISIFKILLKQFMKQFQKNELGKKLLSGTHPEGHPVYRMCKRNTTIGTTINSTNQIHVHDIKVIKRKPEVGIGTLHKMAQCNYYYLEFAFTTVVGQENTTTSARFYFSHLISSLPNM